MKDLTITGKHLKTELIVLLFCFLFAFGFNVYSIISYDTQWKELYTQLPLVLVVTLVVYVFTWVVRLLYFGIQKFIRKISRK